MHFLVLWLDGVYGWEPGRGRPEFHDPREVLDADVQQSVQRIRDRVLRALRKAGKWVDVDAAADSDDGAGDELLPLFVEVPVGFEPRRQPAVLLLRATPMLPRELDRGTVFEFDLPLLWQ